MEFGVFDWNDRDPLVLANAYEQRLRVEGKCFAGSTWT